MILFSWQTVQAWEPTKPIEFVIPAGTGGGADQMARLNQAGLDGVCRRRMERVRSSPRHRSATTIKSSKERTFTADRGEKEIFFDLSRAQCCERYALEGWPTNLYPAHHQETE